MHWVMIPEDEIQSIRELMLTLPRQQNIASRARAVSLDLERSSGAINWQAMTNRLGKQGFSIENSSYDSIESIEMALDAFSDKYGITNLLKEPLLSIAPQGWYAYLGHLKEKIISWLPKGVEHASFFEICHPWNLVYLKESHEVVISSNFGYVVKEDPEAPAQWLVQVLMELKFFCLSYELSENGIEDLYGLLEKELAAKNQGRLKLSDLQFLKGNQVIPVSGFTTPVAVYVDGDSGKMCLPLFRLHRLQMARATCLEKVIPATNVGQVIPESAVVVDSPRRGVKEVFAVASEGKRIHVFLPEVWKENVNTFWEIKEKRYLLLLPLLFMGIKGVFLALLVAGAMHKNRDAIQVVQPEDEAVPAGKISQWSSQFAHIEPYWKQNATEKNSKKVLPEMV
jgi:hypothetical protein